MTVFHDALTVGCDTQTRFLFELRVVEGTQWYLDAFVNGPGYNQALMFPAKQPRRNLDMLGRGI